MLPRFARAAVVAILLPLAASAATTSNAADALVEQGAARERAGDWAGAATLFEEAAERAKSDEAGRSEWLALDRLASARLAEGKHNEAIVAGFRALGVARTLGDEGAVAESHAALALVYAETTDDLAAYANFDQAAEILSRIGRPADAAVVLENAGRFATRRSDWKQVAGLSTREAAAHRAAKNPAGEVSSLVRVSLAWDQAGDTGQSGNARIEARQLATDTKQGSAFVRAWDGFADTLWSQGKKREAADLWERGQKVTASLSPPDEHMFIMRRALVALDAGDEATALNLADETARNAAAAGVAAGAGRASFVKALAALTRKDGVSAVTWFERSASELSTANAPSDHAAVLDLLASLSAQQGQWKRAAERLALAGEEYARAHEDGNELAAFEKLAIARTVLGDEAGAKEATTRAEAIAVRSGAARNGSSVREFASLAAAALPKPAPTAQTTPPTAKQNRRPPPPPPPPPEPSYTPRRVFFELGGEYMWITPTTATPQTVIAVNPWLKISRLELDTSFGRTSDDTWMYRADAYLGVNTHFDFISFGLSTGIGLNGATTTEGDSRFVLRKTFGVPLRLSASVSLSSRLRLMGFGRIRWNLNDGRNADSTGFELLDKAGFDDADAGVELTMRVGVPIAIGWKRGVLHGAKTTSVYLSFSL